MVQLRRWISLIPLILVTLVIAHDLVFMVGYGASYHEALAHTGHEAGWEPTVAVVLLAAAVLLGLSLWRLHRLGLLARNLVADAGRLSPAPAVFVGRMLTLWARLAVLTTLVFVLQENFEHLHAGERLPALRVLGSAEYPFAGLIVAGVALVIAAVATLLRWRRERLAARIGAAVRRSASPEPVVVRPSLELDRRPSSHVGRGLAVRAPPVLPV